MNMKTDNAAQVGMHVFEAAGLGKAPFRFAGYSENWFVIPGVMRKPGGSCDFCGASIAGEFSVRSADGKTFKVGCDCIMKAGEAGILKAYKSSPEYRAAQRAKAAAKGAADRAFVTEWINANADALKSQPHPYGYVDRKTGQPLTRWDSLQWSLGHYGASGLASLARGIKKGTVKL